MRTRSGAGRRRQRTAGMGAAVALVGLLAASAGVTQSSERSYDARLIGVVADVTGPESIWIGAIEVRLRSPFVFEEKREEAFEFLRALAAPGREVECRLTGERTSGPGGGVLFGDCVVFGPTDGREIDLGARLIERGFARPCEEEIATIQIWPPVFECR